MFSAFILIFYTGESKRRLGERYSQKFGGKEGEERQNHNSLSLASESDFNSVTQGREA